MSNVNTATISGNITRDPEQVEGHQIVKFGVAVNRRFKKDDEYQDEVSFFDVTVFGNFADLVMRKLRKGQAVIVKGRLKQESWEKDGDKRSKIVLIAEDIDGPGMYVKDEDVPAPSEATETPAPNDDEIPF